MTYFPDDRCRRTGDIDYDSIMGLFKCFELAGKKIFTHEMSFALRDSCLDQVPVPL